MISIFRRTVFYIVLDVKGLKTFAILVGVRQSSSRYVELSIL